MSAATVAAAAAAAASAAAAAVSGGSSGARGAAAPEEPRGRLPVEDIRKSCRGTIEEFWSNSKSTAIVLDSFKDLRKRGADMAKAVCCLLREALEHRGVEIKDRVAPFKDVLLTAVQSADTLTQRDLTAGLTLLMAQLHEVLEEIPKAATPLAHLLAAMVAEGKVPLSVVKGILDATPIEDGGDPPLVDMGDAEGFVFDLVVEVKSLKGEAEAKSLWQASGLQLQAFCIPRADLEEADRKAEAVERLTGDAEERGVAFLASSA